MKTKNQIFSIGGNKKMKTEIKQKYVSLVATKKLSNLTTQLM
jgi:hypothetical protein